MTVLRRPAIARVRRASGVVGIVLSLILFGARVIAVEPEAAGGQLFAVHCANCHGPNGEGSRGPTLATAVLPRAPTEEALIKVMTTGIPGTEMPRFQLERNEIKQIAAWVRHLGQIPPEPLPGDPAQGERIYRTAGNCALCHQLHGYGGVVGPDLTSIGRRRGVAYLRRALVDPGADVPQSMNLPQNFVMVTAISRDGQETSGVRVNEDTYSIQMRDFAGQLHSYFKSELASLRKDWGKSPMPSYAGALTPVQIGDIVAFLVEQKG
jgi:putative heme-binding domain-containing protein